MKSVLVTGGSGSFGQAFVERLLNFRIKTMEMPGGTTLWLPDDAPDRIVVYSRGEHLQEEMAAKFKDDRLRFFIGDIRDRNRLEMAMRGVDTVIHTAALKIVPIAEYNPTECIATNVYGAENVVKSALRAGVKRVIALSTDKAVNPINLYGASKLAAEKIFVAANALSAGDCAFSVVRYGNVAGSRGSVIPLFKRLALEGRPLPITDERMTRFHITMDQAIDLVLMAAQNMVGREIFVPKIPSIKIMDLAMSIMTMGIKIIGIRPGEKIHETLISEDEARISASFDGYYVIGEEYEKYTGIKTAYTSDTNTEWLTVEQLREMI